MTKGTFHPTTTRFGRAGRTHNGTRTGRRGRPPKFAEPSRSVTLTLPESVIAALQAIDEDLSFAVARLTAPWTTGDGSNGPEVTSYGRGAVIVVPDSAALREHTGVELVPVGGGRALICFDERLTPSHVELKLGDAVANAAMDPTDRELFERVLAILRDARQSERTTLGERSIIVLQRQGGSRTKHGPNA